MPAPIARQEQDRATAYLLLRAILGTNICVHGVSRLLAGPTAFAHTLVPMFAKTPLPGWQVYAFGLVLPWAEATLGLLLLFGLRTRLAIYGGSLLLCVLTFGSSLRQDWDAAGLQLIYALIYAVLLAALPYNRFSFDGWRSRNRT